MSKPCLPVALTLLAALGPTPLPAQTATKPSLTVVLSLDGLSWSRLEYYRPWYVSGLKRLLDEGQVETGARYRHLNTETSPGHAALATGAPPRVTGVVANRWIEQNPDGSMRSVGAAQQWATDVVPGQPPLFYREVEKDGRLYVFALARELELWERSGETGRAVVRLGEGPKGETVVFDSEDAITLFNQKHGRPPETFPPKATVAGPGNLRVPTLADRLVEASPQSRVVVVSGKDRTTVFLAGRDRRHVAYWYDQETGRFVTSSAYDTFGLVGSAGRALVSRFNAQKAGSQVPVRFGTLWERLPAPASRVGFGDPALPAPASTLWDFQLPTNGLGFPHDLRLSERGLLLRRLRQPARGRAHRGPGGGLRRRRDLPAGPRRGAGRADDRLLRPGRRVSQLRERVGGEPRHDPPSRPPGRPRLRRARASPAPGLVRRRDVGRPRLRGHPRGGEGPQPVLLRGAPREHRAHDADRLRAAQPLSVGPALPAARLPSGLRRRGMERRLQSPRVPDAHGRGPLRSRGPARSPSPTSTPPSRRRSPPSSPRRSRRCSWCPGATAGRPTTLPPSSRGTTSTRSARATPSSSRARVSSCTGTRAAARTTARTTPTTRTSRSSSGGPRSRPGGRTARRRPTTWRPRWRVFWG